MIKYLKGTNLLNITCDLLSLTGDGGILIGTAVDKEAV